MRLRISFACFLLLLTLSGPIAVSQTSRRRAPTKLSPRQVAAAIYPATVSVYVSDGEGERYTGSGFIVGPNLVATCYHLIRHAERISVGLRVKDEYDRLLDELRGTKSQTSRRLATVFRYDEDSDLALLRVSLPKGAKLLKLSTKQDYYIGETVYTLGNPSGMEGTFSSGLISNLVKIDEVHYLQFTAPVSPGSSGGPVVDDRAQVVGIVNMQIAEAQNLNFAVLVYHLESLITGRTRKITIDDDVSVLKNWLRL